MPANTTTKWNVMARLYPGSAPVPCKDADGAILVFDEAEALEAARKYRAGNSGSTAGGGPHYFAQAVSS